MTFRDTGTNKPAENERVVIFILEVSIPRSSGSVASLCCASRKHRTVTMDLLNRLVLTYEGTVSVRLFWFKLVTRTELKPLKQNLTQEMARLCWSLDLKLCVVYTPVLVDVALHLEDSECHFVSQSARQACLFQCKKCDRGNTKVFRWEKARSFVHFEIVKRTKKIVNTQHRLRTCRCWSSWKRERQLQTVFCKRNVRAGEDTSFPNVRLRKHNAALRPSVWLHSDRWRCYLVRLPLQKCRSLLRADRYVRVWVVFHRNNSFGLHVRGGSPIFPDELQLYVALWRCYSVRPRETEYEDRGKKVDWKAWFSALLLIFLRRQNEVLVWNFLPWWTTFLAVDLLASFWERWGWTAGNAGSLLINSSLRLMSLFVEHNSGGMSCSRLKQTNMQWQLSLLSGIIGTSPGPRCRLKQFAARSSCHKGSTAKRTMVGACWFTVTSQFGCCLIFFGPEGAVTRCWVRGVSSPGSSATSYRCNQSLTETLHLFFRGIEPCPGTSVSTNWIRFLLQRVACSD